MFVVSSHNYKTKCADAPHAFPADLPHFAKNRRRSCRPPHTHSRRFRPPLWWLSPPLRRALVNLHSSSLHLQYSRGAKKAQYVSFFCKITVTLAKCDGNIVIFAYCDIILLHFLWILTSHSIFSALCNITTLFIPKHCIKNFTKQKYPHLYTKYK